MDESKYTKLSDLKGLEGAPNVPDVPEISEIKDLPKSISKKSRLAFAVGFNYRQHPEEVNDESLGVVDLNSYLKSIATSIEESQPEMLDFLQSIALTPQNYLEEMSDDEIKTVVKGWKTHQVDNEEYQRQCDEYLGYMLEPEVEPVIPEDSAEVQEEATPAVAQTSETELKAESITIDESRLPYKLKAVIAGKEKTPYFIFLSPVAQVASPEELRKYVEACRQVLVETNGKFYPRFAVEKGRLVVGVGPNGKIDNWQEIDAFSVEELVDFTKKSKTEVEKYLALRRKKFAVMTDSEKKERGDFEDVINRSNMQLSELIKPMPFKQAIQSMAVLDTWVEAIGEKRFKELLGIPKPTQPERNINRWSTDEEHFNSPEFQAKAKAFMELLKTRFETLEKALGYKSILSELSQNAGLKGTEALYLLGKETLVGARQEFLKEFQKLYNLSMDGLKEYLKDHPLAEAPENETMTKAKVLKYSLLGYVRAKPLPTDLWHVKKVVETKPEIVDTPEVKKVVVEPVIVEPAREAESVVVKPAKKELKYVAEIFGTEEIGSDEDGLFGSLSDEALDRISKALS